MLQLPLIKLPDPDRSFVLETDASTVAVGAVLKQHFDSFGSEYPVAFFSRALTATERNYSAYELEMYAVVRAVERFRVYLLGRPFLLRTDHMALVNLLKRDLPPTTRVQKWILRLSEYNFTIEHQKGTANVMADILSRLPFASAAESEADSQRARPGPRGETSTPVSGALLGGEPTGLCGLASKEQIGPISAATGEAAQSSATSSSASKCTRDACTQASSMCSGAEGSQALSIPTKINRGTIEILQSDQATNHPASRNNNQQQQTSDPGFRALTGRGLEGPRPPMYCLRVLPESLPKHRVYCSYESMRDTDSNASESESEESCFEEEEEEEVEPTATENAAGPPAESSRSNISMPNVDLPISREGLTEEDFVVPTWSEFAAAVSADNELQEVKKWLETGEVPVPDALAAQSARLKEYAQLREQLTLRDGLIVLKRADDPERELIVVPASLVERIIRYNHEGLGAAHQAAKATAARTLRVFFWVGLKRDVSMYVAVCPVCSKYFRMQKLPRAGLRPMDVGGRGECLAMDIVGGQGSFPQTARANTYILTMIDCFTRFAVAVPLPDQSSESIISAVLGNYILIYGTPRRILTDQGKSFESESFQNFCKLFRIHKIRTSGYRPQSNGLCERFNQTIKSFLRKLLTDTTRADWDLYLNFAVFAYNTAEHSSTHFSPHFLTFGEEARLPADLVFGLPARTSNSSSSNVQSIQNGGQQLSTLFR